MNRFFVFCLLGLLCVYESTAQTSDVNEGCLPLEVVFNTPPGMSSWFWDFKDGTTSSLENPTNIFLNAGTYDVELYEGQGGVLTGTVSIAIYEKPVPEIVIDPASGCVPLDVQFEDISTTSGNVQILGHEWVFGDGAVSADEDPLHTFNDAGDYFVSLNLETNLSSCDITRIFTDAVQVLDSPIAEFEFVPNVSTACQGPFTVGFLNTSQGGIQYEWDFGNGNTSTAGSPSAQTYTDDGIYTVSLTVSNTECSRTVEKIISIGQPYPNFAVADTVCLGAEIALTNLSPSGDYIWDFGPFGNPVSSNGFEPAVTFSGAGLQTITLSLSSPDGNCSADTSITVFVEEVDASFVQDPTYACEDPTAVSFTANYLGAQEYLWIINGDSILGQSTITVPLEDLNDSLYYSINEEIPLLNTLVITSPSGCVGTATEEFILHKPNALFMPNVAEGCAPLTVVFTDSSEAGENIVEWEWIFGDGTTLVATSDDDVSHTYASPCECAAQLVVTTDLGCKDTSYIIPILVGEELTPDFTVDQTNACPGESIQFIDLTAVDSVDTWHYEMADGLAYHCFYEQNPTLIFTEETGSMDVTLTVGYNGCYSSITQSSLINVQGPIAKAVYEFDCAEPLVYQFADSSQLATSVEWDFGDGNSSILENPIHTYASSGDYEVILTAFSATSGCAPSMDTMQVKVRDIFAGIVHDSTACRGVETLLDASPSLNENNEDCARAYTWYFDDPDLRPINVNNDQWSYVFEESGDYNLTLLVEDVNGCRDTAYSFIAVFGVDVSFEMDHEKICIPDTVQFTDLSISDTTMVSWEWDFGDNTNSIIQNPTQIFTTHNNAGFDVTLTITDTLGCIGESTVNLPTYKPLSQITTDPIIRELCVGEEITFTADDFTSEGSFLNFDWDFGNGEISDQISYTTQYNSEGDFDIQLIFSENATNCTDSVAVNVAVESYPSAGFATSVDTLPVLCYPQNVVFTSADPTIDHFWDFGNGQTANLANPATVFDKGFYTTTLITTTSFGCADTVTASFNVIGPEGDFVVDRETTCKGGEITFSLNNPVDVDSYNWFFGDGLSASNISPITHEYSFFPPNGTTIAKLILYGENGNCPVTLEKPLFFEEIIADFLRNDGDTAICLAPYTLTNTSNVGDGYYWDFGDGTFSNEANITHTYNTAGEYQVTLVVQDSGLGCKDSITKEVILYPLPQPTALGDSVTLGENAEIALVDRDFTSTYYWTPDDEFIDDATSLNPTIIQPPRSMDYTLIETSTDGCIGTDTASVFVNVVRPVFIPNAFTPNGDGINDAFLIFGGLAVEEVETFRVFNRWGGLVYEAQNFAPNEVRHGWDGHFNGKILLPGVYVYTATVRFLDGEVLLYSGDVTVVY